MAEIYEVRHSSPEIKTLGEYCQQIDSPAFKYSGKESDFLKVLTGKTIVDSQGKEKKETNEDRIHAKYITNEEKKYKTKPAKDKLLKVGTKLAIPVTQVERVGLLTQGIEIVSNDIPAFKAKALTDLEADERYVQVKKPIKGKLLRGTTKIDYPSVTVWLWCRSLSDTYDSAGQPAEMKGEIFDLTPFIQKINTTVGKNGGNFQILLPPLTCELETTTDTKGRKNSRYVIKKDSIQVYSTDKIPGRDIGYVAEASLFEGIRVDADKEYVKRNSFLFHNIVNTNDVIFIRFETLGLEADQRYKDSEEFYIGKDKLANRIYDMIGLVDTNTITTNSQSNDVSITITGRDLSKLFIDDGCYFYAFENSQGQLKIAGGSTQENSLIQRLFSDNSLLYLSLYFNTSIEHILQFVIQQLSNIEIVPSGLFESYQQRRNTRFSEVFNQQGDEKNIRIKSLKAQVEDQIYALRKSLQLENSPQGEIVDFTESQKTYNKFYKFLREIRKQKKRKINNDITSGWTKFTWSNDRATKEKVQEDKWPDFLFNDKLSTVKNNIFSSFPISIISTIDKIIDLEDSKPKEEEPRFVEDFAKGIWQIVKLVIDKGVSGRRLVDSSISSANGSLLNFIRKACQEPFVEFYTDTYGDMFHLIVRKPPYDQEGLKSLLRGNVTNEEGQVRTRPAVIDIEYEDVLREDLSFDDREVYSWYHFTPQNIFLGDSNTYSMAFTPAIYLKEYAEIWGSKPLQVVHNYNPYYPLSKSETSDISYYEKQAILDLKYLVESNAYLPFTRKGTLLLNGDRRLKRGNVIRYKPTGEIFFIDTVAQNFSVSDSGIDRTTNITVSRGMFEPLIYGIDLGEKKNISYFNIVNTELVLKKKTYTETYEEKIPIKITTPTPAQSNVSDFSLSPGFNEYLQHQQGPRGARLIVEAAFSNDKVPSDIQKNMSTNVGKGFEYPLTPKRFLAYWIKLYNKKYTTANSKSTQFDSIYLQVSKETGVPFDIIKTFGEIESGHKNLGSNKYGYTGVMALSKSEGRRWGVNIYDPLDNVRGAAYLIKENSKKQLFASRSVKLDSNITTNSFNETTYETIIKTRKYTGLDRDAIFSKFKVNKGIFNFFLRREQFELKEYIVTRQQAKDQGRDDNNNLNEVVVTSVRKKKK